MSVITCSTALSLMKRDLSSETWLDLVEKRRLRAHMGGCVSCKAEFDSRFKEALAKHGIEGVFSGAAQTTAYKLYENCFSEETLKEFMAEVLSAEEQEIVKEHMMSGCLHCSMTAKSIDPKAH